MALIVCPECGREVSDKAKACPHCGCPVKTQDTYLNEDKPKICPRCHLTNPSSTHICDCGYHFTENGVSNFSEPNREGTARKRNSERIKVWLGAGIATLILIAVLVIICTAGNGFGVVESGLSGNDKDAFDRIVAAAVDFKDPSSVRLVSGSFDEDDILCCAISATNSYGAREKSYYRVYSNGYCYETNYPDSIYNRTTALDIEKINKKLEKELSHYS